MSLKLSDTPFQDIGLAPAICRFPMAYKPFVQRTAPVRLKKILVLRRTVFFVLVLASTWFAGVMMSTILSPEGLTPLKWTIICIYTVLFGWISASFWMGLIGFILLASGHDRSNISPPPDGNSRIPSPIKVAVVMPIYNEDVAQVFAGLEVMYESLNTTGQLEHFSFFILSDTDQPDKCRQEEIAWERLCEKVRGTGKIFYRRRKIRIHKKSGNISDFCRRWGSLYKYMVPLDADSLMSGQLMINLVTMMESREDIGILQTAPRGMNQKSLISQINQFAGYAYGPLLWAGFHFWQLDDACFWGHNAIVRLGPFMKFCALPKLSGSLPFGGEILSHDFIEAALMRRAGWGVWLAHELEGSYEGLPPDLSEELKRDFRWCRGNIQHLRLMFMKGISLGHRLLFLNGNMFYFSAFLWFLLLVCMTIYAMIDSSHQPEFFPIPRRLFPDWPTHHRNLSIDLLIMTAIFLFLIKILSFIWVILSRRTRLFGGMVRLSVSIFLETFFSIFLAPIRMFFYSWFIIISLLGGNFDWKSQTRCLKKVSFVELLKAYAAAGLMAVAWGLAAFKVNQTLFLWLSVIVVPLFLAIPISLFMGSPKVGMFFKRSGIFLTPLEVHPPSIISVQT